MGLLDSLLQEKHKSDVENLRRSSRPIIGVLSDSS